MCIENWRIVSILKVPFSLPTGYKSGFWHRKFGTHSGYDTKANTGQIQPTGTPPQVSG